jgi:outer membrane protein assembly factor BamB
VLGDGTVIVGGLDSCFTALSPRGEVLWQFKLNGGAAQQAAVADDGTLYVPTCEGVTAKETGYLYAFGC